MCTLNSHNSSLNELEKLFFLRQEVKKLTKADRKLVSRQPRIGEIMTEIMTDTEYIQTFTSKINFIYEIKWTVSATF